MGCCQPKYRISPELQEELLRNFRLIDTDDSGQIDKEETLKFWTSNFAKLNTDELFRAVDVDHRGRITRGQWLTFWNDVLISGHTEDEIREELSNFTEGEAWCKFEKHKIHGAPILQQNIIMQKSSNTVVRVGVGVIIYNKNSGTILVSVRKDTDMVALPGGHLEMFETVEECSAREIQEETNLKFSPQEFSIYDITNCMRKERNYHYVNYFTLALFQNSHIGQQIKNLEPHKHGDWQWVNYQQLQHEFDKNKLFFGLNDIIQNNFRGSCQKFFDSLNK